MYKKGKNIRVLIVDDSPTVALLLKSIFNNELDMQVVGCAVNGKEAVDMACKFKPDLITMDIRMPVMDGFEATKEIMSTHPIPIVVVSSSVNDEDLKIAFRAIEAGALSVIEKPHGITTEANFEIIRKKLLETVRAMSEIKVIKRGFYSTQFKTQPLYLKKTIKSSYEIIGIGSSTGGPIALQKILSELPNNFPLPIVIVQHMAKGFTKGFVSWLQNYTKLKIKLAENKELLKSSTIYVAPDEYHLLIARDCGNLIAILSDDPKDERFCPSVNVLFNSLSLVCYGTAVGGLLTGMGKDGAQGLLSMHTNKCHTFVQDKESSIVYGMPQTAVSLGAVDNVVKLDKITTYILELISQ